MRSRLIVMLILSLTFTTGCEYQKVLKKGTINEKLEVSRKYYNKGDYARAQIILEGLIGKVPRGSDAEEVYFLYSYCHYGMNDYIMASYHFTNFTVRYPNSKYIEQAAFMVAKCEYEKSLSSELDQTNTKKAIEAIQLFINRYPKSASVETGNKMIDQLRARLHEKALKKAMLYYNMESYLSAYTSFKHAVIDYPDIPDKERVDYFIVKSAFMYAKQSVASSQIERFEQAQEEANDFFANYTDSKYAKEINTLIEDSKSRVKQLNSKNESQ